MRKDTKFALTMAILWTVSAVLAWIVLLTGRGIGFQLFLAIVFTGDAVLQWLNFTKKRQEENNRK